jgi:hypothetical protein
VTPSLALAATITGTLFTLAPVPPQTIRDAHRLIDPTAPYQQDPEVTADLALIARIRAKLPAWQMFGPESLEINMRSIDRAEDRLIEAYGYPVPTWEQRYAARMVVSANTTRIGAMADRLHPLKDCARCRAWEDCPAADRAFLDALHADWVDRWNTTPAV